MSLIMIPGPDAARTLARRPDSQPALGGPGRNRRAPTFALMRRSPPTAFTCRDLPLSAVRLMRDANYPWLLLVPRGQPCRRITDLDAGDQQRSCDEIAKASQALRESRQSDKLNVAALGNVVPQLHVHVIARRAMTRRGRSPLGRGAGESLRSG